MGSFPKAKKKQSSVCVTVVGNFVFSNLGVFKLFFLFFLLIFHVESDLSFVSYLWVAQLNNLPMWNWKLRLFEDFGFFRPMRRGQSWREIPMPSPKPYVKKVFKKKKVSPAAGWNFRVRYAKRRIFFFRLNKLHWKLFQVMGSLVEIAHSSKTNTTL